MSVDELLKSSDFSRIVNHIFCKFNCFNSETQEDVRQVCRLAVLKSIERYSKEKNPNFWVFCKPLMTEYAKNEVNLQRNTVHIPYNRINAAFKEYENVTHSYTSITYDNGDDIDFGIYNEEIYNDLVSDYKRLVGNLDTKTRDIVDMKFGFKETHNGKTDFISIAETVGMSLAKTKELFRKAQDYLQKNLKND